MQKLKDEIISYLLRQPGMLSCLLHKHDLLGSRIAAWFAGEKPVLLIGGEPGNGKSLLMGELIVQHAMLTKLYSALPSSLALISYDHVHYLFLKRLMELKAPGQQDFLPEGETHPEARRLITQILRDVLVFAVQHLSSDTLVVLEAPLIGHRGEDALEALYAWGLGMQIVIMFSPEMWQEMLHQRSGRGTSANALAMQQIHETLLRQRALSLNEPPDGSTLRHSWEQWIAPYEGLVLSWSPHEDAASYIYTREQLKTLNIISDPLAPPVLQKYTSSLIDLVLEIHQNLDNLAFAVQN